MAKKRKQTINELIQYLENEHNNKYWDLKNIIAECAQDKKDIDDVKCAIYDLDETEEAYHKARFLLLKRKR